MKPIIFLSLTVILSGCANMGVDPWDRDLLAQKQMQFNAEPMNDGYTEHIYFSKEGSSGGNGFSGGGCGCN